MQASSAGRSPIARAGAPAASETGLGRACCFTFRVRARLLLQVADLAVQQLLRLLQLARRRVARRRGLRGLPRAAGALSLAQRCSLRRRALQQAAPPAVYRPGAFVNSATAFADRRSLSGTFPINAQGPSAPDHNSTWQRAAYDGVLPCWPLSAPNHKCTRHTNAFETLNHTALQSCARTAASSSAMRCACCSLLAAMPSRAAAASACAAATCARRSCCAAAAAASAAAASSCAAAPPSVRGCGAPAARTAPQQLLTSKQAVKGEAIHVQLTMCQKSAATRTVQRSAAAPAEPCCARSAQAARRRAGAHLRGVRLRARGLQLLPERVHLLGQARLRPRQRVQLRLALARARLRAAHCLSREPRSRRAWVWPARRSQAGMPVLRMCLA